MGKIRVDKGQSKLKKKGLKKVKLSGDGQNIKRVRPNITDQTCLNSDEFEDNISSALASEDRPQISKKSKKRKKKKTSKSIGDGNELNLACLAYLNEWKNDQESWKFEKVKQIRLTSNVFDKDKNAACYDQWRANKIYRWLWKRFIKGKVSENLELLPGYKISSNAQLSSSTGHESVRASWHCPAVLDRRADGPTQLPDKYFDVFLEYMEKASESMKKLLTTRASEVIANVEKWNDLSDKDQLTSPKPKYYEGYERARDLLQHFE